MNDTKETKIFYFHIYSSKYNTISIVSVEMEKYAEGVWYDGARTYLYEYDLNYLTLQTYKENDYSIEVWSDKPNKEMFVNSIKDMLIHLQNDFSEALFELHNVKVKEGE